NRSTPRRDRPRPSPKRPRAGAHRARPSAPEREVRDALFLAQLAFTKVAGGAAEDDKVSLFSAAAQLILEVRFATIDHDPMRRADHLAYVRELYNIAAKLRAAALGRAGGKGSKRHLAIEDLIKLADRILR